MNDTNVTVRKKSPLQWYGYELMLGDKVLANLIEFGHELPSVHFKFEPMPAFAPFKAFFDDESRAHQNPAESENWNAACDRINALGLQLRPYPYGVSGKVMTTFVLQIDAAKATLRF